MRKLRLRDVKQLVQSHRTVMGPVWGGGAWGVQVHLSSDPPRRGLLGSRISPGAGVQPSLTAVVNLTVCLHSRSTAAPTPEKQSCDALWRKQGSLSFAVKHSALGWRGCPGMGPRFGLQKQEKSIEPANTCQLWERWSVLSTPTSQAQRGPPLWASCLQTSPLIS